MGGSHAKRVRADLGTHLSASRVTPQVKPQVAMFTPLPDAMTGIADYSADFIQNLSRHADLDLFVEDVAAVNFKHTGGRCLHHQALPALADRYDVIIYQLGNSPFHHYMLPYVERFPGVVVLHDAYLGHLSHDPGAPAGFIRQVIRDHGGSARAIIRASSDLAAGARRLISDLSCSPIHVHRSVGLLSTPTTRAASSLKTQIRRSAANRRPTTIRSAIPLERQVDRATARGHLGLPADKIVLASFGMWPPRRVCWS